MLDRLRRVTDLFVEGTEAFLGLDDAGSPVVIWVNKLNSFEVEEARKDGMVARGMGLMRLQKEDNAERAALAAAVSGWPEEQLIDALVNQKADELYLDVINELEATEEWSEKMAILRRMPAILTDSRAPADDPRRKELYDLQTEYLDAVRQAQERANNAARRQYQGQPREDLEREYFENWRNRASLDDFMAERRVTELFFAMRDCKATQEGERSEEGHIRWIHTDCDHGTRLLNERSQVRSLPEQVLNIVSDKLDSITVSGRDSGNSDAPQSSSGSVEQPSGPEDSTPSTPEETPLAAPTT